MGSKASGVPIVSGTEIALRLGLNLPKSPNVGSELPTIVASMAIANEEMDWDIKDAVSIDAGSDVTLLR